MTTKKANNEKKGTEIKNGKFPLGKLNFLLMLISGIMIVGGLLLICGSSNNDPAVFNTDIFSSRRLIVGPTIAFLGFVAMAFAIIFEKRK